MTISLRAPESLFDGVSTSSSQTRLDFAIDQIPFSNCALTLRITVLFIVIRVIGDFHLFQFVYSGQNLIHLQSVLVYRF
jgi:hypothetical protein